MKAKTEINPGVCGLVSSIEVSSDDMMMVTLTGKSACPAIEKLILSLQSEELDAYECCLGRMDESPVYLKSFDTVRHIACPVPCAIVKAIEVSAGLALPRDVEIKIKKID
ncbi:MAG: hypothetical protein JXQ23_10550 [Clostridia bacterium]|nr:hypothetical protein [Clostridia bacterium]